MKTSAFLRPQFEAMSSELKSIPRWVCHKGKVPRDPTSLRGNASVTNPYSWGSFSQAESAYEEGGLDGVGFVLNGDGLVAVDLDHVVADGQPDPRAMALLTEIGCQYVELSPSGTGLHGWGRGPNIGGRRGELNGISVELYSASRYLTCTGHPLLVGPLIALPGFASVAEALGRPGTRRATEENGGVQKNAEDVIREPLSSSVDIPVHTLPQGEGERNKKLFELARYLRGEIPEASKAELRVRVSRWHELAEPCIGTKEFAVTWAEFLHAWDSVRTPYGAVLGPILEGIDFNKPIPAYIQDLGYGKVAVHLYRICAALQARAGNQPFFISNRTASELIGVHFTSAQKMFSALIADDVLELVERGSGYRASRYRMKARF